MDDIDPNLVDSAGSTDAELDKREAVSQLIDTPRLAHIWFRIYIEGNSSIKESSDRPSWPEGLTFSQLSDHLTNDLSHETLRNDLDEMSKFDAISELDDGCTTKYRAKFIQMNTENTPKLEDVGSINPKFLGLIGEAFVDNAVQEFLDEFSRKKLKTLIDIYVTTLYEDVDKEYLQQTLRGVDDDTLESLFAAIERVLLELSLDPLWDKDYRPRLPSNMF